MEQIKMLKKYLKSKLFWAIILVNTALAVLLTPYFLETSQFMFCIQTLIWIIGIPIIFGAVLLIASLLKNMLDTSKDPNDILLLS